LQYKKTKTKTLICEGESTSSRREVAGIEIELIEETNKFEPKKTRSQKEPGAFVSKNPRPLKQREKGSKRKYY
jgi:hypothetical protein